MRCCVVFSNVPEGWLVGIDFHFFNTNEVLRGVKNIESGIHVVHFGRDITSVRTGFWVQCDDDQVHVVYYDAQNEEFLCGDQVGEINLAREKAKLYEYLPFMVSYVADSSWVELTSHLDLDQIKFILNNGFKIDTAMTSTEENSLLLQALAQSSNNRNLPNDPVVSSIIDQSDQEIKYSQIETDKLKTIRPNGSQQEKTLDSLDKSWYFAQFLLVHYNSSFPKFYCELEFCFLNFVIFGNFSSFYQWEKMLTLVFKSFKFDASNLTFFKQFLHILVLQFRKLPDEYSSDFVNQRQLVKLVNDSEIELEEAAVAELSELKAVLSDKLGISFQPSEHQGDEDDGSGEDYDDDELPVVVEL